MTYKEKNYVLRSVYIAPEMDDKLRLEAFARRTSKNDLIRQYLEIGMGLNKPKSPKGKRKLGRPNTSQAKHKRNAQRVFAQDPREARPAATRNEPASSRPHG